MIQNEVIARALSNTGIEALNEMGAEILPIDEDTSVIQYVKADSID